jgi:hypothetical protein
MSAEMIVRGIEQLKKLVPDKAKGLDKLFEIAANKGDWRDLFHSYDELSKMKDLPWVVDKIAHEEEVTVIAGLPKHGKTWFLLSVVKALLTGNKLFGFFVVKKSKRVIYYIPEVGKRPFWKRIKKMGLEPFVESGSLLIRTLSMTDGGLVPLDDTRLLEIAKGSDIFLDTFVRFIEGDEQQASDISKGLARNVFGLIGAGARSVWGAHHSPKDFERQRVMNLSNMLRGSGDIGAFISNAYGLRQIDPSKNLCHIECLGGHDLDEYVEPFHIQGIPYINDKKDFKLTAKPGEVGTLDKVLPNSKQSGRKSSLSDEQKEIARALKDSGNTHKQVASELKVSVDVIDRLFKKSNPKLQAMAHEEGE